MGDVSQPPADSRRQADAAPEPESAGQADAGQSADGRETGGGGPPGDGRPGRGRRIRTRHIAWLALAVAVGHIVYAFIRDHALDLTRGSW